MSIKNAKWVHEINTEVQKEIARWLHYLDPEYPAPDWSFYFPENDMSIKREKIDTSGRHVD